MKQSKKKTITEEVHIDPKEIPAKIIKVKPTFKQQLSYVLISLALISSITLFILTIINSNNLIEQLKTIVSVSILVLFSLSFVFTALFADNKKGQGFVIVSSFLLTTFSIFNILDMQGMLKLPTQDIVPSFTNKNIIEVLNWSEQRNIKINQTYENSDKYDEYMIIDQSIEANTLSKNIDIIDVIVSSGPDLTKSMIFPNMVGKNVDELITFVEENHFSDVEVNFIISDTPKDTVLTQDKSGLLPRNTKIIITVSIGQESDIVPITLIDLTSKSKFYATTWLKRYGFKYELATDYSNTIKNNHVISQSKEAGKIFDPKLDQVDLVISKGNKITIPNLMTMSINDINKWIVDNRLRINFVEEYHNEIELGKIIKVSHQEGTIVEANTVITVTISKGILKVPSYNTLAEYLDWATNSNVTIDQSYEFSTSVSEGSIINIDPAIGSTLNANSSIKIIISSGKEYTVPNLIGKTKNEIQKICNDNSLNCDFTSSYSDTVASGRSIRQSKTVGSKISNKATITVVMSLGKKATTPVKPTPTPIVCDKSKTVQIFLRVGTSYNETVNMLKESYPNIKWSFSSGDPGYGNDGMFYTESKNAIHGKYFNFCDTVSVKIIKK